MDTYKGYRFKYEIYAEDNLIVGRIIGIDDIVSFEATTPSDLIKSFHQSVDDYLDVCKQRGKQPKKPTSGKINLRMGEERHYSVATVVEASEQYKSINDWINSAIDEKYKKEA